MCTKILVSEKNSDNELSIFPCKNDFKNSIPLDKLYKTYNQQLIICDEISHNISLRYMKIFDCSYNQSINIVRVSVASILPLFLDRLNRVNNVIKPSSHSFSTYNHKEYNGSLSISKICNLSAKSSDFNNYLICCVGRVWNLPKINYKKNKYCENTDKKISHTSRIYSKISFGAIVTRFNIFLEIFLHIFFAKNKRIPTAALQRNELPFIRYGYYIKYLSNIRWPIKKDISNKINKDLRNKIFTKGICDCLELDHFFIDINLDKNKIVNAKIAIIDILIDLYDVESLEMFVENTAISKNIMDKYVSSCFLFSGIPNVRTNYLVSAAIANRKTIIGMQHGGGYGYLKNTLVHFLEFRVCDTYISYGWKKLSKEFDQKMHITPLPVPWLSEKESYWGNADYNVDKDYDILFLCRGLNSFPVSPFMGIYNTIDNLHLVLNELNDILIKLTSENINILHKPQNKSKVRIIKEMLEKSTWFDSNFYTLVENPDKGFSIKTISKSHIVLWDLPSTGFMECLAGKIPTLLYWPNTIINYPMFYEGDWSKKYFSKLENVGILHRNTETLTIEINNYKASPNEWMSSEDRIMAVKEFTDEYCKTSKNWKKDWEDFFLDIEKIS